jgi:hypothetical protein
LEGALNLLHFLANGTSSHLIKVCFGNRKAFIFLYQAIDSSNTNHAENPKNSLIKNNFDILDISDTIR